MRKWLRNGERLALARRLAAAKRLLAACVNNRLAVLLAVVAALLALVERRDVEALVKLLRGW